MPVLKEIIDAHAHLIWPTLLKQVDQVIKRAQKQGITTIINTGIKYDDFEPCLRLGKQFPIIKNIIGIHPEEAVQPDVDVKLFKDHFRKHSEEFLALGEIGLDYLQVRDSSLRKFQEQIFRDQLDFAIEMQKPVVIHCRWAEKHAVNILEEEKYSDLPGVLLHCFIGAEKYIARSLEHDNWYFTIPTSVYYKKINQEIAKRLPIEKIMLETDAPFLQPKPEFEVNEPQYLKFSIEKISTLKNISKDDIAEITTHNCKSFFNLK
ncbi:D-aminoacyl-tRNA deacylase [Candidatus Lokiarchaeum ossiferum]|uniref:D-aminoacyl-tRNA deacylase n=1 Tax=Candidatus Lokiarchaeum ossiferum TaxID=2951803 RepID=A0ABY6I1S6_9ARCH|nr:D-aminoacyl-tRNA deacylase [Candidatus Lokiarchaeum sp. B-35]